MTNTPSGIIIDDDIDLVDTTAMFLEINGIHVKGKGYNGCDADKLYQQVKPDFVLLDMKMPNYGGEYAITKIKEQDPNAKIFVITGYTDHEFLVNEVVKVFTKPCNLKQLIKSIKISLVN